VLYPLPCNCLFLFTRQLITLGVGSNVFAMLRIAAWIQAAAAIGYSYGNNFVWAVKKIIWIAVGPVFVFTSFCYWRNT